MTVDEFNGFLLKNADKINNRQNFCIDNPPQKLHQGVALVNSNQTPVASSFQNKPIFTSEYKIENKNATLVFPSYLNVEYVQPVYVEKP